MLTATSIVPNDKTPYPVSTSLVEGLFERAGYVARVIPTSTSQIRCDHCARVAFEMRGDCLIVLSRHDSQWHKTVVALSDLGLMRING